MNKDINNIFYTKEKTINGVKYVAQFSGMKTALRAQDVCRVNGEISMLRLAEYIFDNIIVEPANLDVDDFDSIAELDEVVAFGNEVMRGKFRAKNKGTGKAGSEK